MQFTFVHTADWQIGKRFGAFPSEKAAVLREERLRAVDRVAEAARGAGAAAVLVAGDVFDSETVSEALIGTLLARLKAHPKLAWHLLPGNHDPARAGGVWEAVARTGLPPNVVVHTEPRTAQLAPGVVLLPAPLTAKSTSRDPTQWMDAAATPSGTLRIGLAHGSVQGFGSEGEANVPLDPARAKSAQLSYLALGDWHGTTAISERVWYSGTPEPDSFPDNEPGHALIVTIEGVGAAPKVERVATAHFTWARRRQTLESAAGLDAIEAEIARLGSAAARRLIDLKLDGMVTLAERAAIEARLAQLATQVFHLQTDLTALRAETAASDLEALGSGVLGTVAERLKGAAGGGGEDCASCRARPAQALCAGAARASGGRVVKLKAIRLKEVGRFRDPIALEGLSGGLDVLAGPNELGKSTILKAVKLALFEKHTSNKREIDALRPYAGGAPLVEVDFEIDGAPWRIRKQYLSGRAAELKDLRSGTVARGGDAETELASLLSHAGRFALLWVDQGGSLVPLAPAAGSLAAVVESEVESVADGGAARLVQQSLKAELADLVTSHAPPRPTGRYKAALDERQTLERQCEEAGRRLAGAEARLDRLQQVRDQIALASDPAAAAAQTQTAATAKRALEEARAAREKCRHAEETRRAHQERFETRKGALADLDGKLADLSKLEAAAAHDAPAIEDLKRRTSEGEAKERESRQRRDEIKAALAAAEHELQGDRGGDPFAGADAALAGRACRRGRAQDAQRGARRQRAEETLVKAARNKAGSIATIEARLSAAAPSVSIAYAPGVKGKIKVAGRALADGETLLPTRPVALAIEGIGVVTVAPGRSESAAGDEADLAAHKSALADLLRRIGVASVDEAEQRLGARREIEGSLADAGTRLKTLAPDGLERLERVHCELAAQSGAAPASARTLEAVAAAARDLIDELSAAEARLDEAVGGHAGAREAFLQLCARSEERRRQIEGYVASLGEAAVRAARREKVAALLAEAETALNKAVRDLAAWRETAPDDARFAALESTAATAEAARAGQERQLAELRRTEAGLEGELKADRADDVEAHLSELKEACALAQSRVADLAEEVAALQRLARELDAAATETRDRFAKPVIDRLAPYLDLVFPDARAHLGEGFALSALERAAGVEELASLSEGTQEQLAVLVRLGFGRLLAETGTPAPLILDDALVYADDTRIERMFAALKLGAESHQVLVLTCRERTFAGLDGNRIALRPWRQG